MTPDEQAELSEAQMMAADLAVTVGILIRRQGMKPIVITEEEREQALELRTAVGKFHGTRQDGKKDWVFQILNDRSEA